MLHTEKLQFIEMLKFAGRYGGNTNVRGAEALMQRPKSKSPQLPPLPPFPPEINKNTLGAGAAALMGRRPSAVATQAPVQGPQKKPRRLFTSPKGF